MTKFINRKITFARKARPVDFQNRIGNSYALTKNKLSSAAETSSPVSKKRNVWGLVRTERSLQKEAGLVHPQAECAAGIYFRPVNAAIPRPPNGSVRRHLLTPTTQHLI